MHVIHVLMNVHAGVQVDIHFFSGENELVCFTGEKNLYKWNLKILNTLC